MDNTTKKAQLNKESRKKSVLSGPTTESGGVVKAGPLRKDNFF